MLSPLTEYEFIRQNKKLFKSFGRVQNLISELNLHELPSATEQAVAFEIENINNAPQEAKAYRKVLRKAYVQITAKVRRDLGLVPKNYYMTLGMTMGMAAFGIPLGFAFASAMGNMGLFSLGLPIGLGIGLAIGAGLDEKAAKEGKQLTIAV